MISSEKGSIGYDESTQQNMRKQRLKAKTVRIILGLIFICFGIYFYIIGSDSSGWSPPNQGLYLLKGEPIPPNIKFR